MKASASSIAAPARSRGGLGSVRKSAQFGIAVVSNIDPVSLLLAREANVVVYGQTFAAGLKAVLDRAIVDDSERVKPDDHAARGWIAKLRDAAAYLRVRFATVLLARGRGRGRGH